MAGLRAWTVAAAVGASVTVGGLPAQAEAPGLYYSWRSIDGDLTNCLDRAAKALSDQSLSNIQIEGTSVSGTTENASAAFVCMVDTSATTVMIMVSSTDDDVAVLLREALKGTF